METKIQNRFKKLQRKKTFNYGDCHVSPSPKDCPKKTKDSCWTAVPEQPDDDNVVKSSMASIKEELRKGKKNHGKIKELMHKTYQKRWAKILKDLKPITDVLWMFPPLQSLLYVSIGHGLMKIFQMCWRMVCCAL